MANPTLDTVICGDPIGRGSCGEVLAVTGSELPLVVKRFNSMSVDRWFLTRNFERLEAMPPVEGMPEVFDYQVDSTPYCVLSERIEGEPLTECLGAKEHDEWAIIRSLAEILGHAHKHGVFHGHLHPGNILFQRDDPASRKKKGKKAGKPIVTDFGTGMIGEIHHIDLGESGFFIAPEQVASAGKDWVEGKAQRWDVYSFGVIAFWLINERLPRGLGYIKERTRSLADSGGRPVPVDLAAFAEDVFDNPDVSWGMSFAVSREHKLLREIIDRCLSLDPSERPVDMREVRNLFRAIDHQFALDHAEDRVVKERLKQKGKLIGARAMAVCLGFSFLLATFYLVGYLKKTYFFQNKVSELDQVVTTQQATIVHLDERWAETVTDLKTSRRAADSFFQKMAQGQSAGGSGVASLRREDLEKSREYYLKTLKDVEKGEETALERARAFHSLAHIERKMGIDKKAVQHFEDAIAEFEKLHGSERDDDEVVYDVHMRLADSYENVSSLLENPIGDEALASLTKAVGYFDLLLIIQPEALEVVMRQAGTSYKLGRALDAHRRFEEAIAAYSRSAAHATDLVEKSPNDSESLTELIGKLQFSVATSLRNAGRIDQSIDAHIASMETIENLRHVNGFSPLQSIQLASSFVELGELFAEKEATEEDLDQLYNESLRLLTPLNIENPEDVEVAVLLCRSLMRLGELEREAGRWSAGYRLSVRGIETLIESLGPEPNHVEGLLVTAEARLKHLQFLEDEKEAALKIALKGLGNVESAQKLLDESNGAKTGGIRIYEPLLSHMNERLGRTFQQYGDVCQDLGDTENANRCYHQASIAVASSASDPELVTE